MILSKQTLTTFLKEILGVLVYFKALFFIYTCNTTLHFCKGQESQISQLFFLNLCFPHVGYKFRSKSHITVHDTIF